MPVMQLGAQEELQRSNQRAEARKQSITFYNWPIARPMLSKGASKHSSAARPQTPQPNTPAPQQQHHYVHDSKTHGWKENEHGSFT